MREVAVTREVIPTGLSKKVTFHTQNQSHTITKKVGQPDTFFILFHKAVFTREEIPADLTGKVLCRESFVRAF